MKLINRKSPEIILNGGRSVSRQYLTVEKGRIYFTSAASRACGLKSGLYVNFLNEGADWQFFVNDDTDGFKLTVVTAKNGFHITNSGLINMILKSTGGFKPPKMFRIDKTDVVQDKSPIYSISPVLGKPRSRY